MWPDLEISETWKTKIAPSSPADITYLPFGEMAILLTLP